MRALALVAAVSGLEATASLRLRAAAIERRLCHGGAVSLRAPGGSWVRVAPLPTEIGRDPASGIPLRDPAVSRRHALLRAEGDDIVIADLGSRTGVRLGGARLEQGAALPLRGSGELALGATTVLRFQAATGLVTLEGASGLDRGMRALAGTAPLPIETLLPGTEGLTIGIDRQSGPFAPAPRRRGARRRASHRARLRSPARRRHRGRRLGRAARGRMNERRRSGRRRARGAGGRSDGGRAGAPPSPRTPPRRRRRAPSLRARAHRCRGARGRPAGAGAAGSPAGKGVEKDGSGGPPGVAERARRRARAGRAGRSGRRRRRGGGTLGAAAGGRHRRRAGTRPPRSPPPGVAVAASPERSGGDRRDAGLARGGRDAALSPGAGDRPRRHGDRLPGARRGARSVGRAQDPPPAAGRRTPHGAARRDSWPARASWPGCDTRAWWRSTTSTSRRARWPWNGSPAAPCAARLGRPPGRATAPTSWRPPRAASWPPWRFCTRRGSSTATSSRRTSSCGPRARSCWPTSALPCS